MTVTVTGTGLNRTFTYSKLSTLVKITDMGEKAAHYLFDLGFGNHGTPESPITFAELTNPQMLALLDGYITRSLRDLAFTYDENEVVNSARLTVQVADFDLDV